MKYTTELKINLPRTRVIELFDSNENMFKWQKNLVSFDHLGGDPGKEGAKSNLKYKMGKREVEMVETITKMNLPDEFSGTYEAKGVWNFQQNFFKETQDGLTNWISISEFKCKGWMAILCWLMPGAFKKQTLKFMNEFKDFAENEK